MKLVAIIIAFYPDKNQLISNIEKLILDVDQLLIYRNSAIDIESDFIDRYKEKIFFLGTEKNDGIGKALNAGVYWAKSNNFSHILTLDQDSYFEVGHLLQFRKFIEGTKDYENAGVFVPNFINKGNLCMPLATSPLEVSNGITSGSIIPISIFSIVGGFNNFLFIDGVDNEFCYRIRKIHGMKTIMIPTIHLIHELGHHKKSIFGFTTLNYSSFRTFYIVRNHILLWRKYPKYYSKVEKIMILKDIIIYRIIKVILAEKHKRRKIKSILLGIFYGFRCNL